MTSADVGGEAFAGPALVGVPLIAGLVAEGADPTGLADGEAGALTAAGESGAAELAPASALGWLTSAEQAANDATPSSMKRAVPRRYPTGGGYGRSAG